jgi:hypothetical protein
MPAAGGCPPALPQPVMPLSEKQAIAQQNTSRAPATRRPRSLFERLVMSTRKNAKLSGNLDANILPL